MIWWLEDQLQAGGFLGGPIPLKDDLKRMKKGWETDSAATHYYTLCRDLRRLLERLQEFRYAYELRKRNQ